MSDRWHSIKRGWKQTRAFLADDSSILSWFANLLIAFVVIKFIIYPLLSLLFGASLPVVAVVSSSMDHDLIDGNICGKHSQTSIGSFEDYWNLCGGWYETRNITAEQFQTYPFDSGFKKGDIMVLVGPSRNSIEQGDVLVFEAQQQYPIIHRIVQIHESSTGTVYATKGDHNADQIQEYVVSNAFGSSHCHNEGRPQPCPLGALVTADTPGAQRLIDETAITDDMVIGTAVLRIPWLGWIKIWFTDALTYLINR